MSFWSAWICATAIIRRRGAARFSRKCWSVLRALPGVRSASASAATPIDNSLSAFDLQIEGYTSKSKEDTDVYFNNVSDRFFETLGTDLMAGRDFNEYDTPESPKVAIVNQTLAKKFFAGQNPIGRRYRKGIGNKLGDLVEIVGVVKDAKYVSLREQHSPHCLLCREPGCRSEDESTTFELRVAAGAPTAVIPAVKSVDRRGQSRRVLGIQDAGASGR